MNEKQQQDAINQQALQETQKFITDAMQMINQTYAACGVEAFKPEPLMIPQIITDSPKMNLDEIGGNDFYRQAEAMWQGQAQFFNGQVAPPPEAPMGIGEQPENISDQMVQAAVNLNGPVDPGALQASDQESVSPELQALLGE